MQLLTSLARFALSGVILFSLILNIALLPQSDCDAGILISDRWINGGDDTLILYWLDPQRGMVLPYLRVPTNSNQNHELSRVQISPDHARLAYRLGWSYGDGEGVSGDVDLYTVDCEGANRQILTVENDEWFEKLLSWSPDGSQLAYTTTSYEVGGPITISHNRLVVVNADGTGTRTLYEVQSYHIEWLYWSTQGILFAQQEEVYRLNANGSAEVVASGLQYYDWNTAAISPDGTQLLLLNYITEQLWLMDLDTYQIELFFTDVLSRTNRGTSPVWLNQAAIWLLGNDPNTGDFVLYTLDAETAALTVTPLSLPDADLCGSASGEALLCSNAPDEQYFRLDTQGNLHQLTHFPPDR